VAGTDQAQMSPLAAFLAHASLEAGDHQASEGAEAVQLMTVHSAKGLEFDAVFITGLEEGLFPHENAVAEEHGLEEERRLMYVAITRARARLYLSFSQTRMLHGQTRYSLKSRFLEELPEAAMKWLTPRAGAGRGSWREAWGGGWTGFGGQRSGQGGSTRDAGTATHDNQPASWSEAVHQASRGDRAVAQRFERGLALRVGQTVAHARFGEGVIIDLEGSGSDARAQVNFGDAGVKWLALSVAKLEPVG
jgi:DNA helicase-2/ATP-dependent DNA helicase PcrA